MNYNDVRIGKEIFIDALTKAGVRIKDERGKLRQTPREQIVVKDILLPVSFRHPELRRVHEEFKNLIITNTKGDFKLSADLDGFTLDYGTGGLHGSVNDRLIESDSEWVIIDADCVSMYPSVSIQYNLYPEHLGEKFCDVYRSIFEERSKHKKGTPENAAYKLALNGVYGQSNSEFSPFFDPAFTMSITLGGQLLLSMLCERIMYLGDDAELAQVNTDGITARVRRSALDKYYDVCKDWEKESRLTLEYAQYKKMYISDVNNYVAEYE
jgi:DNA polymerase elongation subunit (family B)